jgi:hypothetical protein
MHFIRAFIRVIRDIRVKKKLTLITRMPHESMHSIRAFIRVIRVKKNFDLIFIKLRAHIAACPRRSLSLSLTAFSNTPDNLASA